MIEIINDDFNNVLDEILEKYKERKIIIVSDPPFNINYHYKSYKDKLKQDEYDKLLYKAFSKAPSVVIHYPEQLHRLSFILNKIPTKIVSWIYNSNTAKQHRDIAFYDIQPNFNQVKQPYKNLNDKRIRERIARGIGGEDYMIGGMLIKLKMLIKRKQLIRVKCH